jgi:hypothetical protein
MHQCQLEKSVLLTIILHFISFASILMGLFATELIHSSDSSHSVSLMQCTSSGLQADDDKTLALLSKMILPCSPAKSMVL